MERCRRGLGRGKEGERMTGMQKRLLPLSCGFDVG